MKNRTAPANYYNRERREMLQIIPAGSKKILDVGCGQGFFGAIAAEKIGAEVWGIEPDKKSAKAASKKMKNVINLDFTSAVKMLPDRAFDCVVFNDVLEHMADPGSALRAIRCKLAKHGVVIASIPNVMHVSVMKKILMKDWKYQSDGVLDETHLRFFTRKSARRMFAENGYEVSLTKGINPTRSPLAILLSVISLGYMDECRYLQYAIAAKPSGKPVSVADKRDKK